MSRKSELAREQTEIAAELAALCPRGATVWTVLRSVSSSGMSRKLDFYVMRDNEPRRITWQMCKLGIAGMRYDDKKEAATIGGCGMDMGFHAVYSLAARLYGTDDRGAYSLTHRWM